MNILFITAGITPVPAVQGGAVENLVQMFLDYNEENHFNNITVVSIDSPKAKIKANEFKYCKFIFISKKGIMFKISRAIRHLINKYTPKTIGNAYITKSIKALKKLRDEPDIVIVENNPTFGLVLKDRFKGKLLLHLHNDFLNRSTKNAEKMYNSFSKILVISGYLKDRVKTVCNKEDNISILYNGVDLSKFNNLKEIKKEILREKFNIKQNDKVIIYSGRLVKEKGVKELILAVEQILSRNEKNIKLIVCGSVHYDTKKTDDFSKELVSLAEKYKEYLVFSGYIPYEKMPDMYSIAHIGVIPSIWEEPFGMIVVEQLAMGIPLVVTNSGAIPEIVGDGSTIIVDKNNNIVENLASAILKLLYDENLCRALSKKAKERAEIFSSKIYNEKFQKILFNQLYLGEGDDKIK